MRIRISYKSQVEIQASRENNLLNKVTSYLIHLLCPNEFSSKPSSNKCPINTSNKSTNMNQANLKIKLSHSLRCMTASLESKIIILRPCNDIDKYSYKLTK